MDSDLQSELNCIKYPRTYDFKKWEVFLGRKLITWEQNILKRAWAEIIFNRSMRVLYKACAENNMFVPYLTKLNGNCLYDSLSYHNIGSSDNAFRKGLAFIMYMFRNYKDLLPDNEDNLLEWFNNINSADDGIKYVSCRNKHMAKGEKDFYPYTYEVMCQDITNDGSWSRINPYLFFAVLSLIYKIEIVILSVIDKSHYKTVINVYQNCENKPEIEIVYIANIDNFHYLPIGILTNELQQARKLYYNDSRAEFKKWALKMEKEQKDAYTNTRCDMMSNTSDTVYMNDLVKDIDSMYINEDCNDNLNDFVDCHQINQEMDTIGHINYQ